MKRARQKRIRERKRQIDGGREEDKSNQERKGGGRRRLEAVKQTMSKQKGERSSQVTGHSEGREREERRTREGKRRGGEGGE